ncbi:Histone-lysine n-methyltransferase ashh2 [Thalictrum thalictroides]|uniref:Histone-lysine n-methyltransferase ashh2 n=1 Tax=Thalictrum thalictroides TaxID=46969 RepID=A0A7J6WPC7_THATH|nr:Histone-lysine n-methyltransferase ashh2 [Thalictrum thalictroides]
MGSYAPLDNEVRDGVMEDEIGIINSNFSETSLFAKTEEDSVLEQFSFTDSDNQFVQNQSIVEGLVTDCTLTSDVKEDVFDISGAFHDFVDSYAFQEDVIVKTDIEEKMSVSDFREIYSTETGKAIHSFCLESGEDFGLRNSGSQHDGDVGSLADYVKTPILSSSLSTQPSEYVELDDYNIIENAIGPLEKTGKDLLEVHEENQDLSTGVKTDLMTPKQQIAECHAVDPLEETVKDHLGVHKVKQELSSGVEIDLMSRAEQIEKSPCVLVRELSNSVSAFTTQLSTSSQLSGAVGDAPCRQLLLDDQERDGLSGGSSASPETEGYEKPELISRSTCSDIIISVPRRSTRQNKWCQNSQGGKTSAQRGKTRNKKLQGELFLNTVRRKRSSCKRARSSLWGSLQNIIQVKENAATRKDCNHSIQEENQSSHERWDVPENGRWQKTHAESLLAAKGKQYASNEKTSHFRLKVKLGGQNGKRSLNIVQPEVLDHPAVLPINVSQYVAKPSKAISSEMSETDDDSEHKLDDGLYDNRQVLYADGELENPVSLPDPHYLDSVPVEKDLESTLTQDTSVGNNFGDCPRGYSQNTTEEMEAIGKQFLDPGTSPDSEVINLIQDVSIGADAVLTIVQAVEPTESAASNMELMSLRKQNKSRKVKGTPDSLVESFAAKEKLLGQGKQNKAKKSAKYRREEKIESCGHSPDTSSLEAIRDDPKNSSQRHTLELTKPRIQGGLLKVKINNGSSEDKHVGIESSQLLSPNEFSMGLKPSSKQGVESREQKSGAPLPAKNRRKNACEQKKEGINKSLSQRKVKEKDSHSQGVRSGQCHQEASGDISIPSETVDQSKLGGAAGLIKDNIMGLEIPSDTGISAARNFTSEDLSKLTLLSSSLDGQLLPTQNAWVCCDDCCKWRCISTALADSIEATNCRWTCKDNMDKAFADCSIPQEKSNAEINAELEISEASGEEDASYAYPVSKRFEVKPLTVPQQAPWRPIQSNLFLHRNRKANTIDEIMVCQCKPPKEGGLGCGDGCLNRVLNIECVRGTCPCGDHCSNQRFQKRNYAKLEYFRCGKKGYGLQLLENVCRGDFLIEYVGEVLDLNAYEARQREYASRGQKHFYFMTLNGSEVIDACAKGNLGRFINHSCDPNCSTEKWIVNGEVCIGLFAIRNIKKAPPRL